jgi:hypothetical protein
MVKLNLQRFSGFNPPLDRMYPPRDFLNFCNRSADKVLDQVRMRSGSRVQKRTTVPQSVVTAKLTVNRIEYRPVA